MTNRSVPAHVLVVESPTAVMRLPVRHFRHGLQVLQQQPLPTTRDLPEPPVRKRIAAVHAVIESRRPHGVNSQQRQQRRGQPIVHLEESAVVPERLRVTGWIGFIRREELAENAQLAAIEVHVGPDTQGVVMHSVADDIGAVEDEQPGTVQSERLRQVEIGVFAGGGVKAVVAAIGKAGSPTDAALGLHDRSARGRSAVRRMSAGRRTRRAAEQHRARCSHSGCRSDRVGPRVDGSAVTRSTAARTIHP